MQHKHLSTFVFHSFLPFFCSKGQRIGRKTDDRKVKGKHKRVERRRCHTKAELEILLQLARLSGICTISAVNLLTTHNTRTTDDSKRTPKGSIPLKQWMILCISPIVWLFISNTPTHDRPKYTLSTY